MARFIEHTTQALQLAPVHLTRALLYFGDAEQQPMPRGSSVDWAQVKNDISQAVRAWERQRDRGPER